MKLHAGPGSPRTLDLASSQSPTTGPPGRSRAPLGSPPLGLHGHCILVVFRVLAAGLPSPRGALSLPAVRGYVRERTDPVLSHRVHLQTSPAPGGTHGKAPCGGHCQAPLAWGPLPGTSLQWGGCCPQSPDLPLKPVPPTGANKPGAEAQVSPRPAGGPARCALARHSGTQGRPFSGTLHLSRAAGFVLCYQLAVVCGDASVHITFANFLSSSSFSY